KVRLSIDHDAVGELTHAVLRALSQRETVIQAQEVETAVFGAVLDHEHDVVESVDHVIGQTIELVDHQRFEVSSIHFHRYQPIAVGRPDGQCRSTSRPATAMKRTPNTAFRIRCPRAERVSRRKGRAAVAKKPHMTSTSTTITVAMSVRYCGSCG